PILLLDRRAGPLQDPDRLGQIVPLELEVQELAPSLSHLLLHELGHVARPAIVRLLPDPCRGCEIPALQGVAGLAEHAFGALDLHAHRSHLLDQAVSVIDRPAGIVEVLRLGLEPSQDALVEVPGAVVVARLHATDRFEETGGDGVRARLSLGRSDFLDEAFDAASDEVDEGNVEGATGVGDQRDRAFDVPPFACLDRVVDDPLPFLDLEADPFRGDEERLDFVHELRESAGTEALHTGHSYSVDSPSENSAPQAGHTVASAATRVSQTGQRNFSPSSRDTEVADAASTSPDSGELRATLFRDSMISRWSS